MPWPEDRRFSEGGRHGGACLLLLSGASSQSVAPPCSPGGSDGLGSPSYRSGPIDDKGHSLTSVAVDDPLIVHLTPPFTRLERVAPDANL